MSRATPHRLGLRSALFFLLGLACSSAAEPPAIAAQPLAPRSAPRGATMFTALSAEQTGIATENRYADPRMWSDRYQELTYGAFGTGVAIGDFDNDGLPDVFIVSKTESSRLFRNLGHWKFEDVTEKSGLAPSAGALGWLKRSMGSGGSNETLENWRQGATFVDVNNDGWLDLYVCRFGAPNQLFMNQRDGTFKEEGAARGLAIVDACGMAAFCDYDRDGWLDVYVQTNLFDASKQPNGRRDYLFHNNRDGTFTDVSDKSGISRSDSPGHSATWWDYDDDGWTDLYVCNDYGAPDYLYHNNRDGTFTNVIDDAMPHLPYYAMGSDIGDVNNDGRLDLFVAEMAATTHEKDQRGPASSRSRAQLEPENPAQAPQYMRNALFLKTGTGHFLEAACLAGLSATDWTWSARWEDLDNDGRVDLHVTNGMNREYHNVDLLERMMGVENLGEGRLMMKATTPLAERNLAFRNLGDLQFEDVSAAWGLDQRGISFGAAFGDLDGDGDLDLVFGNYEQSATVLRNDCDQGHRIVLALRGTVSNRFGVGTVARIETASGQQVRALTLARGYLSSSEPVLHFGLGKDTIVKRLTLVWPSGQTQTFADLAVDQRYTITEPAAKPSPQPAAGAVAKSQFVEVSAATHLSLSAREKPEKAATATLMPTRFSRRGPGAAVADLNGDGRENLVVAATSQEPLRILLSTTNGDWTPSASELGDAAAFDGPPLAFDADGDGSIDLFLTRAEARSPADANARQPALLLNDGSGRFQRGPSDALPQLSLSVGAAAAADFNHDGHLDVFLGARVLPGKYPLPPRSALLVNRGGRFEDVTDQLAPALREIGMVTSALWSDVDDDGWPDLLLTLEWGRVCYFHNRQGAGFEDWTELAGFATAGTGWWTSIAAADFNGDGRMDYVVGNVGLNTPYRASPDRPALLFYGPLVDGGAPQIIEAYYEGDRLYPWRTRKDLAAKAPALLKRFPQNDAYARATLQEIVGENRLASARRFAATEFRSGVLLSQPDGKFRFEPLPRLAQIAPLQGMAAGDFDGDGHADIFAVQNSYAPIPSVGRFDGGLSVFLRGDGAGHFTAAEPLETGLVVPGDAKALAVLDLNGDSWPDFFVARNNATSLAFQNQPVAGRHIVKVQLKGVPSNPNAVGARVTLVLSDGSKQIAEVYCGGGYASQSSSSLFFGYADSAKPQAIEVRWPTGRTSRAQVSTGDAVLTLSEAVK